MGGSLSGTYSKIIWDMTTLFDKDKDMRVLPVLGKGSVKGIEDLLWLRGIDTAIVQSDVLEFMTEFKVYPDLDNLMRYITVLFNEEVHLIARTEFKSIEDLEGKRVSFGPATSGGFMTASIIFDRLKVSVDALSEPHQIGLNMLLNGEIDAMVRVAGAPVSQLEDIESDGRLHLISVPPIEGAYYTSELNADMYPSLIPHGETIKTVAVAAVLAAYNWPADHPRRQPVETLFNKLQDRYTQSFRWILIMPSGRKWTSIAIFLVGHVGQIPDQRHNSMITVPSGCSRPCGRRAPRLVHIARSI